MGDNSQERSVIETLLRQILQEIIRIRELIAATLIRGDQYQPQEIPPAIKVQNNGSVVQVFSISDTKCANCEGLISWDLYPERQFPLHVKENGTILGNGDCPKFKKRGAKKL